MSTLLKQEEQNTLRHRFLNDDLFRHWSLILCHFERSYKEVNPVSIWFETERLIQRFKDAGDYNDAEVPYVYTELTEAHGQVVAITLMTVLFTRLANAAESAEKSDENRHKPLCIAILREVSNEPLFEQLIKAFESQKLDNKGQKVFIKSTDPMNTKDIQEAMDQIAQKENEYILNQITDLTSGLNSVLNKEHWQKWQLIWKDICNDAELITIVKRTNSPRGSKWGLNEKMIFNVLGIFLEVFSYNNFGSTANNAITKINRREYIYNHAYKNGSSTELSTKELHEKVESIVKNTANN